MQQLIIVGAGLAGAEAAWQAAKRGIKVQLWEMRPKETTPAHKTELFAELVCSNSLRANSTENAVGLLKEEMRRLDSLIVSSADRNQVPAGGALAVDRTGFSREITDVLINHPQIEVVREKIKEIPDGRPVIVASGPLTANGLAKEIKKITGEQYFYFYDAAAPIITFDSIDQTKVFRASRYDKGEAAYLNCPMTQEEYEVFYEELIHADVNPLQQFEKEIYFEGCMPLEVMALRGQQTLLFGPLKPVGLINPYTGKQPYAIVQLRQDNNEGTLYNLVGFQTHLKWPEQERVFRLIPGLEKAEFVRYGVMHRNSYINSPKLLQQTNQLRTDPSLFFAGQITGVEGYVESAASGLIAGLNAGRWVKGEQLLEFPEETAIGSLLSYITDAPAQNFQPMNINFGLLAPLGYKVKKKKEKNSLLARRSLELLTNFIIINKI